MRRAKSYLLPLLLLVSACTTVQVGRETVDTSGERYEEWNYYYGTVRLPGAKDSHVKVLQIKFDGRGVVRGYTWSGEPG